VRTQPQPVLGEQRVVGVVLGVELLADLVGRLLPELRVGLLVDLCLVPLVESPELLAPVLELLAAHRRDARGEPGEELEALGDVVGADRRPLSDRDRVAFVVDPVDLAGRDPLLDLVAREALGAARLQRELHEQPTRVHHALHLDAEVHDGYGGRAQEQAPGGPVAHCPLEPWSRLGSRAAPARACRNRRRRVAPLVFEGLHRPIRMVEWPCLIPDASKPPIRL
jgi:hypothetical protein